MERPSVISPEGLDLVIHFEGLYLEAYQDGGGVWTIGYGHTGLVHQDGTVYPGRRITAEKARELLAYDMRNAEKDVLRLVKVKLLQREFDALVSFQFNTGALEDSTLLKMLNNEHRHDAADQFLRWDHDNGVRVRGLTRRRQSERRLFLGLRPAIVPA